MVKLAIGLLAGVALAAGGCSPSTPRVVVPDRADGNPYVTNERDPVKPMPPQPDRDAPSIMPAPVAEPLRASDQRAFIASYDRIGRPRMALAVTSQIPGDSVDSGDIETIFADWFSAGGEVMLVSPSAARQRLTEQQFKDLQSGNDQLALPAAEHVSADVLLKVLVQPASPGGPAAARIVSEALNVRGGKSVGHAALDVDQPLGPAQVERSTRLVALKLMDDITATWNAAPVPSATVPAVPAAPTTAPATH